MEHNIYITNFWFSRDNYGANLTAFALQCLLNNSYLIDNSLWKNDIAYRKWTFSFDFQKTYLKTTKRMDKNCEQLNNTSNTFITGSDQVFRPIYTQDNPELYWLDFVKSTSKKIAFSASFGVNKDSFLEENAPEVIEHMKNSLHSFDFISVREKSGVEICRDVLGVEAEWIIDPVFVLDRSKYDELITNANGKILKQVQNDTIVSYVLDTNKEYKKAYKYLSEKYGGEVVETANSNISVESWLKSIRDCKLFVTDSFHGMCFAIIFNKPFICISNKSRGAARFESIVEMLGIENQCVNSIDESYKKDCVFKVDWDGVNRRIDEERQRGLEFLKKALEAPCGKFEEKQAVRIKYLEDRICELESQANLKYQIKKELWNIWLVIFHKYLPEPVKTIIRLARNKYVRK